MSLRPRRVGQDVAAGALLAASGAFGLWLAQDFRVGTALRMGPGYFPTLLCWLLIGLGALIALRGMRAGDTPLERWHLRPLVLVIAGLFAFRYLIETGGLLPAAIVTVLFGAAASREFRARESVLLALGLAIGSILLFVYALGQPMKIAPFWD